MDAQESDAKTATQVVRFHDSDAAMNSSLATPGSAHWDRTGRPNGLWGVLKLEDHESTLKRLLASIDLTVNVLECISKPDQ